MPGAEAGYYGQGRRNKIESPLYPELISGETEELYRAFMQEREFAAGATIATPGKPLSGVYFIRSGIVTPHHPDQNFGHRGIYFHRDYTFGEYALLRGRAFPTSLTARTPVETWYLGPDAYAQARLRFPGLPFAVEARAKLTETLPDLVQALKRHPSFRGVPIHVIARLAKKGQVITLDPTLGLSDRRLAMEPGDWIYVAEGALGARQGVELYAGHVFQWSDTEEPMAVHGAASVIRIRLKKKLVISSSQVQVALEHVAPSGSRPRSETIAIVRNQALFDSESHRHIAPALRAVGALLVDAMRTLPGWSSRNVGLMTLQPEAHARETAGQKYLETIGAPLRFAAANGSGVEKLDELKRETATVVVDAQTCDLGFVDQELMPHVDKVVLLGFGPDDPYPLYLEQKEVIRCALPPITPVGTHSPYYPGTVRLTFDNLGRLPTSTLARLPDRDQQSIRRLARAVAGLRVGVALGGGGAWGFAHVALIQELVRAGVPIDVLSGVSCGSLVAGFYAAKGEPGLEMLLDKALTLQLAYAAGLLPLASTIETAIDALLGRQRLEFLDIPFVPVSLDLNSGEEAYIRKGTVGHGIHAASAMPGFIAPVVETASNLRCIDGFYVNNVPEGSLVEECADFIIASDVVQSTVRAPETWWTRTMAFANPLERLGDNMRGLGILGHISDIRDQDMANARFKSPTTLAPMWAFYRAKEICESAREQAAEFAGRARRQWQAGSWR